LSWKFVRVNTESIKAGWIDEPRHAFKLYLDYFLPHATKDSDTHWYIVSDMIGVASDQRDPELYQRVLADEVLLGQALSEVGYARLFYNLACYQAKHGKRKLFLDYSKRALDLGKKPNQFLKDSDFEAYWQDEEFLNLLNSASERE